MNYPCGICIDSCNRLYVSNWGGYIQVFAADGIGNGKAKQLFDFGREGRSKGEFDRPWGICVDKYDNIYVCDSNNYRVQVWRIDGRRDNKMRFINQFGSRGSDLSMGQFPHPPRSIGIDEEGNIYIGCYEVDDEKQEVVVWCFDHY